MQDAASLVTELASRLVMLVSFLVGAITGQRGEECCACPEYRLTLTLESIDGKTRERSDSCWARACRSNAGASCSRKAG